MGEVEKEMKKINCEEVESRLAIKQGEHFSSMFQVINQSISNPHLRPCTDTRFALFHKQQSHKPRTNVHIPASSNLAVDIERFLGPHTCSWIDPQFVRLRSALRASTLSFPISFETDQVGRVDRGDGGIAITDGICWTSRKAAAVVIVRSVLLPSAGWSVRVRMRV